MTGRQLWTAALESVVAVGLLWLASQWTLPAAIGVAVGTLLYGTHRVARQVDSTVTGLGMAAAATVIVVAPIAAILLGSIGQPSLGTATAGFAIGLLGLWGLILAVAVLEFGLNGMITTAIALVLTTFAATWALPETAAFARYLAAGAAASVVLYLLSIALRTAFLEDASTVRTDPIAIAFEALTALAVVAIVPVTAAWIAGQTGGIGSFFVGVAAPWVVVVAARRWSVVFDKSRLAWYHDRFVTAAIRDMEAIANAVSKSTARTETHTDASKAVEDAESIVAAAPVRLPAADRFLETAQGSLVGGNKTKAAAAAALAVSIAELTPPVDAYLDGVSRFMEAIEPETGSLSIATVDLSDAQAAHDARDQETARSLSEDAVAAAIGGSGGLVELVVQQLDSVQKSRRSLPIDALLARLEAALALSSAAAIETASPEQSDLSIGELLTRLAAVEDRSVTTSRETVRAAAGTGWEAICRGDRAIDHGALTAAANAYTIAIEAYLRARAAAIESGLQTDEKRISQTLSLLIDGQATVLHAVAIETYGNRSISDSHSDPWSGDHDRSTEDRGHGDAHTHDRSVRRQTLSIGLSALREARTQVGIQSDRVRVVRLFVRRGELRGRVDQINATTDAAATAARAGDRSEAASAYREAANRLETLSERASAAGLADAATTLSRAVVQCEQNAATLHAGSDDIEPVDLSIGDNERAPPPDPKPIGDEIRAALAGDRLVTLRDVLLDAQSHPVSAAYDEATAGTVESMATVVATMDPLFGTPDLDGLEAVTREVLTDALAAVIDRLAGELEATHERDREGVGDRPAVLDADPLGDLAATESLSAFVAVWIDRADELAVAAETIIQPTQSEDAV
ncbi:hypothetical protein [Halalkalirubrum salinum]|uniref:hypothetical protein n=1 Tax=Halalkalirubrum salinum TaxID=2563889 RepID=UPI0010FAD81C|nr:hypothetical protein [Halalkalirubrum salinum]